MPVAVALTARRWLLGAFALVAAAMLAVAVLPRALPDADRGPATGVRAHGHDRSTCSWALPTRQAIVDLVRDHDVVGAGRAGVHAAGSRGLTAAGLGRAAALPGAGRRARHDRVGPLLALPDDGARGRSGADGGNMQAYATIELPGAGAVRGGVGTPARAVRHRRAAATGAPTCAAEPVPDPDGAAADPAR